MEHLDVSSEWGCRTGTHHSNQEWMSGVELGQAGGIIRCLDGMILITFASLLRSGSSEEPCKLSPKSTSGLWGTAGLNSSLIWHDQSLPEAEVKLGISNSQSIFPCFYGFSEFQKWKINKQITNQLTLHRITTFLANSFQSSFIAGNVYILNTCPGIWGLVFMASKGYKNRDTK